MRNRGEHHPVYYGRAPSVNGIGHHGEFKDFPTPIDLNHDFSAGSKKTVGFTKRARCKNRLAAVRKNHIPCLDAGLPRVRTLRHELNLGTVVSTLLVEKFIVGRRSDLIDELRFGDPGCAKRVYARQGTGSAELLRLGPLAFR